MNAKNLALLLSACLIWLVVAAAAFFDSNLLIRNHEQNQRPEHQKAYEKFVENVKNGTWQLTQDKMLQAIDLSREVSRADDRICASAGKLTLLIAWVSVAAIFWQIACILIVKRDLQSK